MTSSSSPVPLAALLADRSHRVVNGDLGALVRGVRQDSRVIGSGECFIAVPGFKVDGHEYLQSALANGAAALIVQSDRRERWSTLDTDAAIIEVDDTRRALPQIAAAFHGEPAQQLTVIGVTGTDGKSTTSYLTRAMLAAAGHRCGLISGIEFQVNGEWRVNRSGETTPEADLIQPLFAEMLAGGTTHVVLEATSHALALHRVDRCNFHTAVFTGLSSDHLDFHKTQDAYLDAKLNLFRALDQTVNASIPPAAVLRADDPQRETAAAVHRQRTVLAAVSAAPGVRADVGVYASNRDAGGSDIRVVTPSGALAARLSLPGDFNISNAALAAAAAWLHGVRPAAIQSALNQLRPVPGRMEPIDCGQPFGVIVDAAATGPALELALSVVRPYAAGRLLVVFGAAGERDPARRSAMGAAAAALADHAYLTSENPRSEDPAAIVREIAEAMRSAGAGDRLSEEPDRRRAIQLALHEARAGDLVLIAGKGAEPTMIYADRIEPWDDRETVRELLNAAAATAVRPQGIP